MRARGGLASLIPALVFAVALGACDGSGAPGGRGEHEIDHGHEEEHAPDESVVELSAEKLARIELELATAVLRTLQPQLETTGEVGYEQDRLAHVSPRIPGRVVRVPARLGDEVAVGEALTVIDSVALGEAKATYLAARVRQEVAHENFERERRLYEDRITSEKEMLEARGAFQEAEAERRSAEETLRLYGLSAAQIGSLRPGDPGSSLLAVRAPISGRIVEKHVTVGELVTPEDNLFTVADLGRVWIWIDVFERDLGAVHEGDEVTVRVDAFPERRFAGEVSYLGSEVASATRRVRARIDVDNSERLLRPGMFATVHLVDPHAGGGAEVLAVPSSAAVRHGDGQAVFVPLSESRFELRQVALGRREGSWIEVRSGLEPGERVVVEGTFFLKSELARDELGGGHAH